MKKLLFIPAMIAAMSFTTPPESHYYVLSTRLNFSGKKILEKEITVDKCHPNDPDIQTAGKRMVQIIYELDQAGFKIISHTTAYGGTMVLDRVIVKTGPELKASR